jgi:hypothetical protein
MCEQRGQGRVSDICHSPVAIPNMEITHGRCTDEEKKRTIMKIIRAVVR